MNIFGIRLLIFSFLTLLQVSMLPLVIPGLKGVPILLLTYAASVLPFRFHAVIGSVVFFAVLSDIGSLERLGVGVVVAVGITYTGSFFSRRYSLEHRVLSPLMLAALVGSGAIVYLGISRVLLAFDVASVGGVMLELLFSQESWRVFLMSAIIFLLTTSVFQRLEHWMQSFDEYAHIK